MWCEFCRDNYAQDHFDPETNYHRVGPQFGPEGLVMWQLREARVLATNPEPPADWQAALRRILSASETETPEDV